MKGERMRRRAKAGAAQGWPTRAEVRDFAEMARLPLRWAIDPIEAAERKKSLVDPKDYAEKAGER